MDNLDIDKLAEIVTKVIMEVLSRCEAPPAQVPDCCQYDAKVIDLTGKRLIHERDLRDHNAQGGDMVKVSANAIITALAHDYAKGIGAKIEKS